MYPYHRKRAELILDQLRRYPHCENATDRADMRFDVELLAQHLSDIEAGAREPADPARPEASTEDCICGSYGQRDHTHACWLALVKRLARLVAEGAEAPSDPPGNTGRYPGYCRITGLVIPCGCKACERGDL